MKAVTGSVTSSKPISLSKAAAILSRFAGTETGARRDIVAYLKRTSNALENLVHVHRELRADRKRLEVDSKEEESEEKRRSKKKNDESSIALEHRKIQIPNGVTENGKVKNKKGINSEEEEKGHTDRKKEKSLVVEEERLDERRKKEKKKKKREREEVENGRVSEEEERARNGKKRRKSD